MLTKAPAGGSFKLTSHIPETQIPPNATAAIAADQPMRFAHGLSPAPSNAANGEENAAGGS